jgi:TolA-binding protein
MMRRLRLSWLILSLMVGLLSSSGCAALVVGAAAGAGGAVYVMGKLQEEVTHPVPTVHQAAVKGLQDLQLPILENKADQLTARLESHLADDRRIWMNLEAVDKERTLLTIRVGLMGDEAQSRRILEAVKKHLPS